MRDSLFREVKSRGAMRLGAEYVPSPRNELMREFLSRAGLSEKAEHRYVIATHGARRLPVHIEWVQKRAVCRLTMQRGKLARTCLC